MYALIGTTLQRLIDEKNTNVNELARTIGVSAQTLYSIIKRDNMKIDFDVLLKICAALNVDVAVFYTDYIKNVRQQEIVDDPLNLSDGEYPIMTKYRRLNDSGKEYIDSQLDYAFSQEKYRPGLTVAANPEEQSEVSTKEETVDIFYAAYGGDSGKVTIPKSQFDEAMKELEKYDYRTDK